MGNDKSINAKRQGRQRKQVIKDGKVVNAEVFGTNKSESSVDANLSGWAAPEPDPVLGDTVIVELAEVQHVGTLETADRKDWSYEGNGLSISVNPDDWADIARLGGDTWTLERTDGTPLRFASWTDLGETERVQLRAWAIDKGWLKEVAVFEMAYFDDEWDTTVTCQFHTLDEAEREADGMDDAATITPVVSWRATSDFPDSRVGDSDPSDVLMGAYVRAQRPDLDGVWWEETYDPDQLSCPRGVIVAPLDRYTKRRD